MKIACLSGKGGAGKTLTAVNLAAVAERAVYIDCDVEEPNGRLFFQPGQVTSSQVSTLLPVFDAERCTGCKKCVQFCRFHALMYIKEKPMVFFRGLSQLRRLQSGLPGKCCYRKRKRPVGRLQIGMAGDVKTVTGILNPGEASGIPVIREALKQAEGLTIIDGPPGSACSVMESVMDADFCILVAEPTAFGFHNFQMVYELVTLLGRKCGVIINKEETPYEPLEDFCREHDLKILCRIPYSPGIGAIGGSRRTRFPKRP